MSLRCIYPCNNIYVDSRCTTSCLYSLLVLTRENTNIMMIMLLIPSKRLLQLHQLLQLQFMHSTLAIPLWSLCLKGAILPFQFISIWLCSLLLLCCSCVKCCGKIFFLLWIDKDPAVLFYFIKKNESIERKIVTHCSLRLCLVLLQKKIQRNLTNLKY